MKADKFSSYFEDSLNNDPVDSLISITKVISTQSLSSFAQTLAFSHEPKAIDFKAKFGIQDKVKTDTLTENLVDTAECPKCGKPMVKRIGKTGKNTGKEFWGCSAYPKCKGVMDIKADKSPELPVTSAAESNTPVCPDCNKPMLKRISTKGRTKGNEFWGCSGYPKCKATLQIDSDIPAKQLQVETIISEIPNCPKCNEPMIKRASKQAGSAGKEFWGCSKFPKCRGVVSIEQTQ